MLWLKRCVVPTQPHEAIVANVVYPAILLTYGRSLGLLPTMVGCPQRRLKVLCQSFSNVVAEENKEGNMVVSPDSEPKMKTPNPHVELPYTYLMAWYVALPIPDVSSAVI